MAAKIDLRMAALMPDRSPPYTLLGHEHTGDAAEIAAEDAKKDGLLTNLNVR